MIDKKTFLINIKSKYTYNDILNYIESIKDLNIIIVGDSIIDEYQYGVTLGKSGKSPIVAFENRNLESYNGGVLAIERHLMDFCNVERYTGKKAIYKKRYIENNQKLFETYSYKDNIFPQTSGKKEINISDYDIVLVADFGHGFIDKILKSKIESEAKYIALNTQLNAGNMGMNTINKYTHRNYISIDHAELRLASSNQFDSLEDIIMEKFTYETVSITKGRDGALLYRNKEIIEVPTFSKTIIDTIGAGDAYLSLTTPLSYIKAPLDIIGFIGNIAGAIACTYPGNKQYMTRDKIYKFIKELYDE